MSRCSQTCLEVYITRRLIYGALSSCSMCVRGGQSPLYGDTAHRTSLIHGAAQAILQVMMGLSSPLIVLAFWL